MVDKEEKVEQPRKQVSFHLKHKKYRTGKVTNNPFLNFMREVRKSAKGKSIFELTSQSAALWRKMGPKERLPYENLAKQACRGRGRRSRRSRRRRSKSARRKRRRSASLRKTK